MERIKIGITQGDINGIGYELILNTFETEEMTSICTPVIYGSPKVATYHRKTLGCETNFQVVESAEAAKDGHLNMINCFGEDEQKIEIGQATEEAGKAALISLDKALTDLKDGKIDALVTSPLNNACIKLDNGTTFQGQTSYIEETMGEGKKALKIFIANNLRIALATDKIPVSEIPGHINKETLAERLVTLHNTLKRDFFIDNPRIAVLALNPHADGQEEQEIITQAFRCGSCHVLRSRCVSIQVSCTQRRRQLHSRSISASHRTSHRSVLRHCRKEHGGRRAAFP